MKIKSILKNCAFSWPKSLSFLTSFQYCSAFTGLLLKLDMNPERDLMRFLTNVMDPLVKLRSNAKKYKYGFNLYQPLHALTAGQAPREWTHATALLRGGE